MIEYIIFYYITSYSIYFYIYIPYILLYTTIFFLLLVARQYLDLISGDEQVLLVYLAYFTSLLENNKSH
jgi:hypothetical protein